LKKKVVYKDLGLIEYSKAWEYQKELLAKGLENKRINHELHLRDESAVNNHLLFCEHPHVYTLGKSGKDQNLLVNETFLKQKGAAFFRTDRGGDITYHGPGQIVGYPIFDLDEFGLGVKQYVHKIEEVIILTLLKFGIQGDRLTGATGVWLDLNKPIMTRKICAIGVKISRSITMHGFAFNINTSLDYYSYINPCGFKDKGVTSLQKETGNEADINVVKSYLLQSFANVFDCEIKKMSV
jgi:lipoyl(octanoyl) transferase